MTKQAMNYLLGQLEHLRPRPGGRPTTDAPSAPS